jgi:hypothetical protein
MFSSQIRRATFLEVNLRPIVSLGARHPSGNRDQFFFLLEISFTVAALLFLAPSLTRGRVCNLQCNCFCALPEQSLLGRSPAELTAIFYCIIWYSPTWKTRFLYLYPSGTGWPGYIPGHWVPFLSPLATRRDYGGGNLTRPHRGLPLFCKLTGTCICTCDWFRLAYFWATMYGRVSNLSHSAAPLKSKHWKEQPSYGAGDTKDGVFLGNTNWVIGYNYRKWIGITCSPLPLPSDGSHSSTVICI